MWHKLMACWLCRLGRGSRLVVARVRVWQEVGVRDLGWAWATGLETASLRAWVTVKGLAWVLEPLLRELHAAWSS
jgi:hypothetical protein